MAVKRRVKAKSIVSKVRLPMLALICAVCFPYARPSADEPAVFHAVQYSRETIYHSPQTPGYTCWVGAWLMPDESMMVTFKQAAGPLEDRPQSVELMKDMGVAVYDPNRDFTGLELANIYLRSTDSGNTWSTVAEDSFPGPFDRPSWGGSHIALADGAILRAVDGSQLPLVPGLPRRIFFQRSHDLGNTWSLPEIPPEPARQAETIGDYGDCISRVKRLSDGRLSATGVIRADPANRRIGKPLLMFSDDEGLNWTPQHIIQPAGHEREAGAWNEWDCAELPNGDLLCVFRRTDTQNRSRQVRWQGIFHHTGGANWELVDYRPSTLEHSGHPELLSVREGIILHIASTGIHYTNDAGATWHLLEGGNPDVVLRSAYYPISFQTGDGRIFVFSHRGWDNGYGEYDQAIVMDSFYLSVR